MSLQLLLYRKQQQYRTGDAFSFSKYRATEDDSDDDESVSEHKHDDDDDEDKDELPEPPSAHALRLRRQRIILTDPAPPAPHYVPALVHTAAEEDEEQFNSEDDEPNDWRNSNTKKRIVAKMKNKDSDIHLQINNDLTKANYRQIYEMYVNKNKYPYKRFQPNFKKLLDSYREKSGPFDPALELEENAPFISAIARPKG